MDAIAKASLLPARRLEGFVPEMKRKGRVAEGADADLVLVVPNTIIDKATFQKPDQFSEGVRALLVRGAPVVRNGQLQEVWPGEPIRAPRQDGPRCRADSRRRRSASSSSAGPISSARRSSRPRSPPGIRSPCSTAVSRIRGCFPISSSSEANGAPTRGTKGSRRWTGAAGMPSSTFGPTPRRW